MTPEQKAALQRAMSGGLTTAQQAAIDRALSGDNQSSQRKVIATTGDGGEVYELPDGTRGFKSPGFATTDPARVSQILEGAQPVDLLQADLDRERIAQNPIAARGAEFIAGTPFIGSYADEAVGMFSPQAADNMRATSEAMQRQNPGQTAALRAGGAVATSIPLAIAAAPTLAANAAPTIGARAVQAAGLGAVVGATEGAIYGAGEGQGQERLGNAQEGAIFGGLAGGVLGAAAPYAAEGIKYALTTLRGRDVSIIAKALGVSAPAARVIKQALDVGDMAQAEAALNRAGGGAMLADAGQPARELLDAAANAGGEAGAIARQSVDERASAASAEMTATLDRFFGKPQGEATARANIRTGTQEARQTAYDAAYATPIDYAAPRGQQIEALMARVPQSAINRANQLMRLEGMESGQIKAIIGDNGSVSFEVLPDVRQLDYITRALNDVAAEADGQGRLGGTTDVGRATKNLATRIRRTLREAVPEYGAALDVAADAISQSNAVELGYDLLRAGTRRETVREALNGASKAEREAAKQGLRSYIDDTLANVSRTLTDPNTDIREGIKLVRDLSSRASMDKVRMLLGKDAANQLATQLEKQAVAFELRSAIATNSKTAIRQSIQGTVADQIAPNALETLTAGKPVDAAQRFIQIFTGNSQEATALREAGIYEEIARALTQTRGAQAKSALALVDRAIKGQSLTEAQARYVGTVVSTSGVLSGGREASRRLSTQ